MSEIGPFRNEDVGGLVAVWNAQPPVPGRLQPLTPALLEQYLLGRAAWDRHQMWVARQGKRVVGWVHAGLSEQWREHTQAAAQGTIWMLQVLPGPDAGPVAAELLKVATSALAQRGTTVIQAGAVGDDVPFYLGIYGGCRLPGFYRNDELLRDTLRAGGFVEHRQVIIWQRELANYRPPVDRELMALRRQARVTGPEPWEPATLGARWALCWAEPVQLRIQVALPKPTEVRLAFWDVEPLAGACGTRVWGLLETSGLDATLPSGMTAFALSESLRHFAVQGSGLIEIQTDADTPALAEACRRLGFQEVGQGTQWQWVTSGAA